MPKYDYDLIIIGCGVSGFTAASMAAGLGKRVLVIDKESSPRDAALRGGLPSKTLVRAAATADVIRTASKFGLIYSSGEIGTSGVLPKVRSVITGMTGLNRNERLHQLGVAYLIGAAEFIDPHHIKINEKTYSADKFVIATGARPVLPKNLGKDGALCLTNETFFKLDTLPKSMIVIGGGPTGIEMALALILLGVEVTVVEAAATILGSEDREAAGHVAEYLSARGIIIFTGHKAAGLKQIGDEFELTITNESGEQVITAERVLFTVGREANVQGLELEKAGVEYDSRAIKVDKHLRTTSPHIMACGDVNGCIHLVGVMEHEGLVAVNNALLPFKQSVVHKDIMWNIFTEPPLAHVGMTEEEVKAEYGFAYKVYRQDYIHIGRAQLEQESVGFAKVICDLNGKLLGAHIFGAGAEAAAHELQLLRALSKPVWRLHDIKHAFPTYSEALVKRIGDIAYLEKMAANPLVRFALKILPGFRNNIEAVKNGL